MKKLKNCIDSWGADRRKREIVFAVCLVACFVCIWVFGELDLWVGVALGFAAGIFGLIFYLNYCRCPHCKKFLGSRNANAQYCPHCGKELD